MLEIELTKQNFKQEVLESSKTVLVDFYATWCGPCKMISPIITQIAKEYEDTLKVGKVNVDEQNELAIQYKIISIPTILIFKNGKVVNTSVGIKSKSELIEMLNN